MDKVVHFEIPFDDANRASGFYSKVFGWQIQNMPEMNYVVVRSVETDDKNMPKETGAINGGMYKRDASSSKAPVIVIEVEKIDDKIKMVEESGGKVIRPKVQVGEMGFYAQVQDTEGNIIGIWENNPKGPTTTPVKGEKPVQEEPHKTENQKAESEMPEAKPEEKSEPEKKEESQAQTATLST